jgi:hypothetical protein
VKRRSGVGNEDAGAARVRAAPEPLPGPRAGRPGRLEGPRSGTVHARRAYPDSAGRAADQPVVTNAHIRHAPVEVQLDLGPTVSIEVHGGHPADRRRGQAREPPIDPHAPAQEQRQSPPVGQTLLVAPRVRPSPVVVETSIDAAIAVEVTGDPLGPGRADPTHAWSKLGSRRDVDVAPAGEASANHSARQSTMVPRIRELQPRDRGVMSARSGRRPTTTCHHRPSATGCPARGRIPCPRRRTRSSSPAHRSRRSRRGATCSRHRESG